MSSLAAIAREALARQANQFDLERRAQRKTPADSIIEYILGLDLGQAQDFSALVGLERTICPILSPTGKKRWQYEVVGVKRWALRTPYTLIAADVAATVMFPPLAGAVLGIDKTGVGAGVLEIIRAARPNARIRPVLITGGHKVSQEHGTLHVPKMELVAAVTSTLESNRLTIPIVNHDAQVLTQELKDFRAKVTKAGNETAEADWRTQKHDDLVLGLAIALFLGEHGSQKFWVSVNGETIR